MTDVICGARAFACWCGLPPGHPEEAHVCANERCKGQWIGDINQPDTFTVIRLPMTDNPYRLPFPLFLIGDE